jgi:TRAP transporter TAXI family solute receptor
MINKKIPIHQEENMKKIFKIASIMMLSLSLAACGSNTSPSADKAEKEAPKPEAKTKALVNIGSAPSSSSWYNYFAAVSGVVNKKSESLETTVVEAGGTMTNAINMAQKKQDIGFTEAFVAYEAYKGEGRFDGSKAPGNPDLRLLWNIAPSAMHWAVTKESGIKTFEDLNGKPFNPSTIGGGGEYYRPCFQ